MRFKKIRIAVLVSLVIFIFVVANIFIFGLIDKSNNSAVPDSRKDQLKSNSPRLTLINTTNDSGGSTSQSDTQTNTESTNSSANTQPVVTPPATQRPRTRAS